MGQTLAVTQKLTSAKDGSGGKLEYTPTNENILNRIVKFVEDFPGQNPNEGNMLFRSPLVWTTELQSTDFTAGFSQKGDLIESDEKSQTGSCYLTLKKKEISVYSFEYLCKVLQIAGDKKISETRACLESNNDPTAKICGDRFANVDGPDSSAYRMAEEIIKSQPKETSGGDEQQEGGTTARDEADQKMKQLKVYTLLKNFDEQLLKEVFIDIGKEVRLTPQEVDRQFGLIRMYCGNDQERHVLQSINWIHPYTCQFENGCRAPSWRQVRGDISYIEAKPHDGEKLSITASTNGYFINCGYDSDKKDIDFEKEGDYYKDLMLLLRDKSAKFNENIDKQDFALLEQDDGAIVDTTADLNPEDQPDGTGQDEANKGPTHRSQKDEDNKKKSEKKKQDKKKKKLEPSLKWKSLGVDQESDDEKNDFKKKKDKKRGRESKSRTPMVEAEDSFSESSTESESEEETPDRRNEANSDLPSEYWQIQKLVKYLKGGNQTATIIALCSMRDFNLAQETCQLAIRDVGGLEVLINLLDTEEAKCKIGSLKILKEISRNQQIRRAIADLGGLQTMVKILRDPNKDLKCLAAETIANVAKFRRARRTVRQHGGIKRLVGLLDCASLNNAMTAEAQKDVEVARCGALALWSCSRSTKNKQAMRKAGVIPLLAKLLKSSHEDMLIPVVGTLQECASEPTYRLAIRTEGMVEDLVKNLKSENQELQMHCASAIFKCAEDEETRDLVRQYGGLDPLVKQLGAGENKELLAASTGAIWKCAISRKNVIRFQELKAIDTILVNLLNDQPEEVLVNVVGALGECAKDPPNRLTIRKAGGIPPLVNLLTGTNQALLVNVTRAVGQCAEEPDNMVVIDKLDGVRLLWSLLKNSNPEVQASAAWAICPCIENAKDAGEMVRSFVGGLELIVSLLKSEDKEVLASVCAAIANIANDEENLAVITDHGVVPMLAKLTYTTDDKLRRHLAEAIARCCNWGNNRVSFGKEGAVAPLVKYLKSNDEDVHRSTARSLFQLSKDPDNCITMHDAGVVKYLVEMVGSQDDVLQVAAAGCIRNIRRLALANEKAKNK